MVHGLLARARVHTMDSSKTHTDCYILSELVFAIQDVRTSKMQPAIRFRFPVSMNIITLVLLIFATAAPFVDAGSVTKDGTVCTVSPSDDGSDDAPAILLAFNDQCNSDSSIVLTNGTFHIEQVMNTTGLRNVSVSLEGTLLWGTNITYWRNASLPLGYQNQTLAWAFGGDDIHFTGNNGAGTLDGNGQIWYDFANGTSNLAGRPINFVLFNTTNSVFEGIRFRQSQFWTMAIFGSSNILLQYIHINSTSNSSAPTQNTDGVDTFFSNNLTFREWNVTCGDDAISPKANSSNILIQDSAFQRTNGVAIGSIGQMVGKFEFIENVTAERVTCIGCEYAAYVKTFTGVENGVPPNGGGGGFGFARNITFRNFTIANLTTGVASISQCTSFLQNGTTTTEGCNTSLFQLSNITWSDMRGSVSTNSVATFQCSGDAPCPGIGLVDVLDNIFTPDGGDGIGNETVTCSNLVAPVGFECTSTD